MPPRQRKTSSHVRRSFVLGDRTGNGQRWRRPNQEYRLAKFRKGLETAQPVIKVLERVVNREILPDMRRVLTLLSIMGATSLASNGQVTNSGAVGLTDLTPQESATVARLNESLIELKTRSTLLLSLAEEHLRKSSQALNQNQPDKARWEQELATELHDKNAVVAKQMSELKLAQTKFEEGRGSLAATQAGASAKGEGLESDELLYLAKLNENLASAEREIAAATDEAQSYVLQLQTNNSPDQVQSVSRLLEDNKRALYEFRKRQTDLELRKLEFWALRRRDKSGSHLQ